MRKLLSVIIPVHNEERRLATCLEHVIPYLSARYPKNHEIIISNNGSHDATHNIAIMYMRAYPHARITVMDVPVRGKGMAIKRGMLQAVGDYRYMCDVDLSTPIESLGAMMGKIHGADIVIGSREIAPAAVHSTFERRLMGRAFHLLVHDLVPGILDTQCGFKLFTARAARLVFSNLLLPGMAFDVEALYIARLMGLTIREMPVPWVHDGDSRVRLVWDSLEMARDVISIPWMHAHVLQNKNPVT